MTDSYHFESVAKFRIGGVYRDGYGTLYRLAESSDSACAFAQRENGLGGWHKSANPHRLADGRFVPIADPKDKYHLIPGELIQRDGQWVAADAPIVFPSGAAVLTSGDKIVGRVEANPATYDVSVGNRLLTTDELHDALRAVLDSLYAAPKTQRAPLPDSDEWRGIGHKAHDTFGPDFIVTKGAVEVTPTPSPTTQGAYPAIAGLLRG